MTSEMQKLQSDMVEKLLEEFEKDKKELTFKAPTGSGKTYMMGDFMDRVLQKDKNVVFLVHTLSKGGLPQQNCDAFKEFNKKFTNLKVKPEPIGSENLSSEERPYIESGYNVYVLGRDSYKTGNTSKKSKGENLGDKKTKGISKLARQETLSNFLEIQKKENKQIYLIKDECHQETKNIDDLQAKCGYFSKIINFSATPSQTPDVEMSEKDAVKVQLIKKISEWNDDESVSVDEVLEHFLKIRQQYLAQAFNGKIINPCLVIQISNKDKAENEILKIKESIDKISKNKAEIINYMIIVDENKRDKNKNNATKCDTNLTALKKQTKKEWKKDARRHDSAIDVIVFKFTISEGWDIPRACMFYQMRDTNSETLTIQALGRVRRNPCLIGYENLSDEQKEIINKAYIYGVKDKDDSATNAVDVRLKGEDSKQNEIQKELKITISTLEKVDEKQGVNDEFWAFLDNLKQNEQKVNFFELYENLDKNKEIAKICAEFVGNDVQKWYKFANNFDEIKKKFEHIAVNYKKRIILHEGHGILGLDSFFMKNDDKTKLVFKDNLYIWQRADDENVFYFDSEAEKEWAEILRDILKNVAKKENLFDGEVYLFGKNYLHNSEIKFEYYLDGYHFSYPDFILKDKKGRIHIFEVKGESKQHEFRKDFMEFFKNDSVGDTTNFSNDERKILELGRIYKAISKAMKDKKIKIPHYFWIPIKLSDDKWFLKCFASNLDDKNFKNDIVSKSALKKELENALG